MNVIAAACAFLLTTAAPSPRITVVDAHGAALQGVKLTALSFATGSKPVVGGGVTDSKGTFDFGSLNLPPNEIVQQVMATAPGFGIGFARMRPDASNCTIVLSLPAAAAVHVLGPNGNPVPGVKVCAQDFFRGQRPTWSSLALDRAHELAPTARTDSSGNLVLRDLPAEARVRFEVLDERFAHLEWNDQVLTGAPGSTANVKLVLKPGASVDGTVTAAGQPMTGIKVGAQSLTGGGWTEALTDQHGRYHLTQLAPDSYNIALDLDAPPSSWTAVAHAAVPIRSGAHLADVDFKLVHGGIVSGTVKFLDGTPDPHTRVGIYGPAHPKSSPWVQSVETDEQGRFSARVPAGEQYVYVQTFVQNQTPLASASPTVQDGGSVVLALKTNRPPEILQVTGTVVDASGRPVSGAEIQESSKDGHQRPLAGGAQSDAEGHFALPVEQDEFPIELRVSKGTAGSVGPIEVKAAGDVRIVIKDGALAAAEGQVTDPTGKPIPGAHAMLFEMRDGTGTSGQSVETDARGRFRIEGLWPDLAFFVEVRATGYGVGQPHADAPGSNTVELPKVVLPIADSFVEGRIVDENGKPCTGASVMVDPYMDRPQITGGDGKFRIDGVPKGKVSVRVFKERNFVERSGETGKDLMFVLKSMPTAPTPPAAPNPIAVGAPAIELKTDGWVSTSPLALADLKGRVVVLDFWAIWCGPCNRELPNVEALARRFAGRPVVVIGVHDSTATVKELQAFAKQKGLTYPLAIDRKATDGFGITNNAYGVQGIPTIVVIGKDGKVAGLPPGAEAAAELVAKLLKG
jgi:thiol-disulfide isomerase/thioredoxin